MFIRVIVFIIHTEYSVVTVKAVAAAHHIIHAARQLRPVNAVLFQKCLYFFHIGQIRGFMPADFLQCAVEHGLQEIFGAVPPHHKGNIIIVIADVNRWFLHAVLQVPQQIRSEFRQAYDMFREVKARYFADVDYFCERSWGMSHDYLLAIEEGSTMVRIGTMIFGPRVY